jgi:hypothetical protein
MSSQHAVRPDAILSHAAFLSLDQFCQYQPLAGEESLGAFYPDDQPARALVQQSSRRCLISARLG